MRRSHPRRWSSSTVMALLVLALSSSSQAEPPPSEHERAHEPDTRDAMRMHMHANFDLVRGIERLLIRGKLKDATRFAEAIAMAPDEPAHGAWASRVVAVRERASEIARATTIDGALSGVAKLGAACGECHAEVATTLAFSPWPPAPADKPTIEARMLRHRWAVDRLWEGIVGNAHDPWLEGLSVLSASPLDVPASRAPLAKQLKQLAERARRDKQSEATRAATYGSILKVCAACHTAAEDEAARPPRPAERR